MLGGTPYYKVARKNTIGLHDMVSDDYTSATNTTQAQGLINKIKTVALKRLSASLSGVLDAANTALIELSNMPECSEDQQIYMDGVRTLGDKRQMVEETFESQLREAFSNFALGLGGNQSNTSDSELDFDEMGLVDDSELEESLVFVDMAEKALTRYPQELFSIEQRFDAIVAEFDVEIDQVPIAPKLVCSSFGESVKALEVETKVKQVINERFNVLLLGKLQPLYDEINDLFIKANVLPNLKRRVKKQPHSEQEEAVVQPAPQSEGAWLDSESVAATPQQQASGVTASAGGEMPDSYILDTMQQLASNQLPGEMTSSGQRVLGSEEMMQALSNIQFDNTAIDSNVSVDETRAALLSEMGALKKAGEYTPLDKSIIDIVTLLFDYILDDENIPSSAKVIIARLQMPMLKMAMLDSALFSSKEHVARQLLDRMAKSIVGLAGDANSENCPLIKKIEDIVVRVLSEFSEDLALFDELLEDFDAYLDTLKAEEYEARQEGLRRVKEKEKRAKVAVEVMDYIASFIEGKDLPRPAYELLEGPWREVMINTYLNEGVKSARWEENKDFIELLLWSVDPDKDEADKKRMGGVILKLVSTINKAVAEIDYPQESMDTILSDLGEFHILSLRNDESIKSSSAVRMKVDPERKNSIEKQSKEDITRELDAMRNSLAQTDDMDTILSEAFDGVKADKKTTSSVFSFDEDSVEEVSFSATSADEKTKPAIDDEYWRMVIEMDAGQWINLIEKEGAPTRAKLAWKSDVLGECTFINWRFKIVSDLNFNQLASRLRNGKAVMLENLPLFERAFDSVMNKLQKGASLLNS